MDKIPKVSEKVLRQIDRQDKNPTNEILERFVKNDRMCISNL